MPARDVSAERWPEWPLAPRCPRCGVRGSDPRAECGAACDSGPDDCAIYREAAAELGYYAEPSPTGRSEANGR